MPIAVRRDPFDKSSQPPKRRTADPTILRVPQARILAALQPNDQSDPVFDWPVVTRAMLGVRAGYTAVSGTVTRALNGIREGSSSGNPHLGLLALGYVEEVILDIDGVKEVNYRATLAGVQAYQAHLAAVGGLPPVRDADVSTNTGRGYKHGEYRQGERSERKRT